VLNDVGGSGQPFRNRLLIFIGCVNVASGFIFITFFSYIFIIAVSNGLGIFLIAVDLTPTNGELE
jgi:hypothetical protein